MAPSLAALALAQEKTGKNGTLSTMARKILLLLILGMVLLAGCQSGPDPEPVKPPEVPKEPANKPEVIPGQLDLSKHEWAVFSQSGEDGIIDALFQVIEPETRYAVEFGASDGVVGSNTRHLFLNKGWSGLLIEGEPEVAKKLKKNYEGHPKVICRQAWVYPGNVELLFEESKVPENLDLLSIDIDSNDYYIWKVIHNFRPKVVIMEINSSFPPPQKAVIEFHPMNYWDLSDYVGASLQSMVDLGKKKGYELVYCTSLGANAIFVDEKYFPSLGIKDNSPETLYKPPQYGIPGKGRHPSGLGHPKWESATVVKDGKTVKRYKDYLEWKEIKIPKKFRHDI